MIVIFREDGKEWIMAAACGQAATKWLLKWDCKNGEA
jgi:hypothetical protein